MTSGQCASKRAYTDVQYGGTARFLSRAIQPAGLEVTYLDFEAAGEEGIRAAIRPDTRVCLPSASSMLRRLVSL